MNLDACISQNTKKKKNDSNHDLNPVQCNTFTENDGRNTVIVYDPILINIACFHSTNFRYDQPFCLDPASLADMEIIIKNLICSS